MGALVGNRRPCAHPRSASGSLWGSRVHRPGPAPDPDPRAVTSGDTPHSLPALPLAPTGSGSKSPVVPALKGATP